MSKLHRIQGQLLRHALVMLCFACSIHGSSAEAKGYEVKVLGEQSAAVIDINNEGTVLGFFHDGVGFRTALLNPGGEFIYVSDASFSLAGVALNDAGVVAGNAFGPPSPATVSRAFQWTPSGLTLFSPAGASPLGAATNSRATHINNSGLTVGYSLIPGGVSGPTCCSSYATSWTSDGTVTLLPQLPGTTSSFARAVNDRGQIVGNAYVPSLPAAGRAVLWDAGVAHDLGPAFVVGINNAGAIIGWSLLPSDVAARGWLWTNFDAVPTVLNMEVVALNDLGQVIGWSLGPDANVLSVNPTWTLSPYSGRSDERHARIWADGTSADLNALLDRATWGDWNLTTPLAINDRGQILVEGINLDGRVGSLLLTPCDDCELVTALEYGERYRLVTGIPEPTSYALTGVGLALLAVRLRRRHMLCGRVANQIGSCA